MPRVKPQDQDHLRPRQLESFQKYISFGGYSRSSHGEATMCYEAKVYLGLVGRTPIECLSWTLVNHPDWIIEDSPIGKALATLLKRASLGTTIINYMEGYNED